MRLIRVCIAAELSGSVLPLPKPTLHYLQKVLRLADGDQLNVFDGNGNERQATLQGASLLLQQTVTPPAPSSLNVTLIQAIARGDRMDTIIQKATELGVARIMPMFTMRSEVKLTGARLAKRLSHWRQIAASACEQCGRAELPKIEEPEQLPTIISQRHAAAPTPPSIVLDPDSQHGLAGLEFSGDCLQLAIGPEGGFDSAEIEMLCNAGFVAAKLGPRILRTETAGPAAIAIAQSQWGDLAD